MTVMNLADVPLQPASPAQAWDDALLATAERHLVRFVGPMARILVRRAAPRARDAPQLYALLAEHNEDPRERERFARAGSGDTGGARTHPPTRFGTAAARATRGTGAPTTGTRTRTPRPLEQAFIDQTTSRLAVYLGPIARVVARKAAQQARDTEEFVQLVAEHIGTQERETFLREVGE
jgi:serine/threonine-protein kinase